MIIFGSRGSRLALTQTEWVARLVQERTGEEFRIEVIETSGDRLQDQPLPEIGIKGLFTAELEAALREGRIDVAVHSLKDLPVDDPEGLALGATPEREDPRDVVVYDPARFDPEGGTLPISGGAKVGTSSPRRASSLLALRPDISLADIRGNVPTRVRKVQEGQYDAVVLAAAGLNRLGQDLGLLQKVELPPGAFTPAPGQGALGIQCRADDARIHEILSSIHHESTQRCVQAERRVLLELGGGCSMPLGVLIQADDAQGYRIQASLFSEDQPGCGVTLDARGDDPDQLADQAVAAFKGLLGSPLQGVRVVLLRPDNAGGRLGNGLILAGADVETVPVTEVVPVHVELADRLQRVVAFSSARAVDRFFELAAAQDIDLSNSTFHAAGPATREAVLHRGRDCTAPDTGSGGEALAQLVLRETPAEAPVLFPCAVERHGAFEEQLLRHSREVHPLELYRKVPIAGIEVPEADFVVLTSPSAIEAARELSSDQPLLAIGNSTAAAMTSAGLVPAGVATAPTPQALVELIRVHLQEA